jgi:phosphate transport system protein
MYSCDNAKMQRSEVRELRERLLLMAGRVEAMLADAVRAVCDRDIELARATIAADRRVNRAEIEMDALCMQILSRCCSLPREDLRFVTLALKMVTDLERIGDLAVNICERAVELRRAVGRGYYREVQRMGELAGTMVKDAISAFVAADAEQAQAVIDQDGEVDRIFETFSGYIIEQIGRDPEMARFGMEMQSVAKWLERAADHATNLAEQVVFLTRGEDVRHSGRLAPVVDLLAHDSADAVPA